jgi:hypothetical protein
MILFTLDMSISREEFLRLLPSAVDVIDAHEAASEFHGNQGHRRWTIHLHPLPDHRLGSVALVRHQVEIHLEGFSPTEAEAFMARFHRGFQRGGG